MASLRERILNAKDIQSETVTIDEWGVEVEVRGMNGSARARLLQNVMDKQGNINLEKMYPELLITTVFDPHSGEQVFQITDQELINAKSGSALDKVAQVAMRLSGLQPGAVQDKEKN